MFFLGLTISTFLLITGIVLLIDSSYGIGAVFLIVAATSFFYLFKRYSLKKKKKKSDGTDCGLGDCVDFDCLSDCDCSPGN